MKPTVTLHRRSGNLDRFIVGTLQRISSCLINRIAPRVSMKCRHLLPQRRLFEKIHVSRLTFDNQLNIILGQACTQHQVESTMEHRIWLMARLTVEERETLRPRLMASEARHRTV